MSSRASTGSNHQQQHSQNYHGGNNGQRINQTSLEAKLELLEARFSQPFTPETATLHPSTSSSFDSPFAGRRPTTSSAMMMASSSNSPHPALYQGGSVASAGGGGGGSNLLFPRSKRSLTSPSSAGASGGGSTLEQVRKAADRQMQKVAETQRFLVASSSCSEVSTESTRLVHNRSSGQQHLMSKKNSPQPVTNPQQQQQQQQPLHSKDAHADDPKALSTPPAPAPPLDTLRKRKSIPIKLEEPSVKENRHRNNNSSSTNKLTRLRNLQQQRKQAGKADENKTESQKGQSSSSASKATKSSKTQRVLMVKDAAEGNQNKSKKGDPANKEQPSEKSAAKSTTARQLTPLQTSRSPRRAGSASREPATTVDNNTTASKRTTRSQRSSLQNNATIHDFFSNAPSTKRQKTKHNNQHHPKDAQLPETTNDKKLPARNNSHKSAQSEKMAKPKAAAAASQLHPASSVASSPDPQLQKRVEELEQTCRDQEEQLKAVANNRTILHTALQTALDQKDRELTQVQQKETRGRHVLEDFVRAEATREARQVRERLASDGARLGRIVYTRGGIRSAAVETWEEGHAVRNLATRQTELRDKRNQMEERYRLATTVAQKWLRQKDAAGIVSETPDGGNNNSGGDATEEEVDRVAGIPIQSKMDALEAVESARYHLETIRTKERELLVEEQSLNDEKGAHIRALKRVASEDASRFRSFPKLHDRYVLKSLLGKGGFSEVFRAFDLSELKDVAVKIHQLDPRWSESKKENYTKHVSREYEIHRNARHPRIVSLFDVFEIDNNSFATVLELCEGSDLDTLLKEKRRLPERDARAILLQILSGLVYLSHPGENEDRPSIIHYDLKPGNILFDEFGDAKITDFGLSKIQEENDTDLTLTSQGAGTYWFLPPEVFVTEGTVRISNKVDVWSIGVIFFQMLFGKKPFGEGSTQDSLLSNQTMLNARQVTFPEKPQVSSECKAFIRKCLTYDQTFRPTVAELCQEPYVTTK